MKKRVRIHVIGAIGLLTLFLAGCAEDPDAASEATSRETMERADAMAPVAVEAVVATRDSLVGDAVASGLLRGSREVTVVAESQGVVTTVDFTLGAPVEEGQVLVAMDDSIQRLAVDEARQTVTSAELDLAATERLVTTGNASQVQLARARSTLAGARARLAQAEKAERDRTIAAPIAGSIASADSSVQVGNHIGIGTPVARIVDTTVLEIELALGEREVQYVAPGSVAYVSFPATGERELEGTVHAVAAGSDQRTGSFPVVVRWRNTLGPRARSGLSATVRIPPARAPRALTVPANAIRRDGSASWVYVASTEGVAVRREVVPGDRVGDRVVVSSGLEAGETVITSGLGALTDGSPVAVTVRAASR